MPEAKEIYGVNLPNEKIKELAESYDSVNFEFSDKHKNLFLKNPYRLKISIRSFISKYFKNSFKTNTEYWYDASKDILSEKLFNNKNLHQAIFENITEKVSEKWLTLQNLESLEIKSWILHIKLNNWDKLAYNLSARSMEDLVLPTTTREDLDSLKEEQDVTTKIMMWWALVTLTYGQFIEFWEFWDKAIDKSSRNFWGMKNQKFLKSIEIPDWEWGKIEVTLNDKMKSLKNNYKISQVDIIKILEKKWVVFNPERMQFEETRQRKLIKYTEAIEYRSIVKRIKSYSYPEYKKYMIDSWISLEEIISEKDFEKSKKDNIKIMKELNKDFNSWKNKNLRFWTYFKNKYFWWFFEKVWWKSLHYLMFPIFFKEVHKHSWNLDSYIKTWVEIWGFMWWAKIWGKIWSKMPWPFKAISSLVLWVTVWWLGAVIWEKWLHSIDKEMLASMPNREDFFERLWMWNKKNVDAHIYTGWVFNDAADSMNEDIWLDFNKVIKFFNKDFEETKSLDINIFENNVNLWTSMIGYLNERTRWVEHWNKEVEEFKIEATKQINKKIFAKDFKYSDVFENTNWFWNHSFEDKIYDWLTHFGKFKKTFMYDLWESASKKIFEFSKANIPEDLLLWTLVGWENTDKKVFDNIKEKLKIFLKENKIFTQRERRKPGSKAESDKIEKEAIDKFVEYYESIFYNQIDEKIDEILWDPNALEGLLWVSWKIHNDTEKTKEGLRKYIKKSYYNSKTKPFKREKDSETWEYTKSHMEIKLSAEIDSLKITDTFVEKYNETISSDDRLLRKALEWNIVIGKIPNSDTYLIEDENWNSLPTNWNISDIIFISEMSEKDREFTREIFEKILHPEKWMIFDWVKEELNNEWYIESVDNHSTMTNTQFEANSKMLKFKKLLENDKYYIFFNRMIDFKRRKVFIDNVKKHNDSVEWNIEDSVVLNLRGTIIDSVDYLLSTKTIKEMNFERKTRF